MSTVQQEGVISSLISYPPDINEYLERYCNAFRKVNGGRHRPPKSQVMVHFFKLGGLPALEAATKTLETQVAKIPRKVPGRRGRPKGSGVKKK